MHITSNCAVTAYEIEPMRDRGLAARTHRLRLFARTLIHHCRGAYTTRRGNPCATNGSGGAGMRTPSLGNNI